MDTDLVVRAQRGDQAAFTSIAERTHSHIQQLSFRILRDHELAADAAQQATLSMWRSLPRLRDPARFEAWCYRLCVNACYKEARRRGRTLPEIGLAHYREPASLAEYDSVIERDELERGFRRLSLDHRTVLVLHHYLGMPLEEVADTLDLPVGTVKSRMNRALSNMRAALETDARPTIGLVQQQEVVR